MGSKFQDILEGYTGQELLNVDAFGALLDRRDEIGVFANLSAAMCEEDMMSRVFDYVRSASDKFNLDSAFSSLSAIASRSNLRVHRRASQTSETSLGEVLSQYDWSSVVKAALFSPSLRGELSAFSSRPPRSTDELRFEVSGVRSDADLLLVSLSVDPEHHEPSIRMKVASELLARGYSDRYTFLERRIASTLGPLRPHLSHAGRARSIKLDFDVGDSGRPKAISMNRPSGTDWLLGPDVYLLQAACEVASRKEVSFDAFRRTFQLRKPKLFWRGSSTGSLITSASAVYENPRVIACRAIAQQLQDYADCRLSRLVQISPEIVNDAKQTLLKLDLFTEEVDEEYFRNYMYYIDLPGNAAAWGTCNKYLSGCLIFRPDQEFELSYSSNLIAWKDFIPVRKDMADLRDKFSWAQRNNQEACQIAWNGCQSVRAFIDQLPNYLNSLFFHYCDRQT